MIVPNIWENKSHVPVTTNRFIPILLEFAAAQPAPPLESSPRQERAVTLFAVGAEVAEEERLRRSRLCPAGPGRAGGPEVWEILVGDVGL